MEWSTKLTYATKNWWNLSFWVMVRVARPNWKEMMEFVLVLCLLHADHWIRNPNCMWIFGLIECYGIRWGFDDGCVVVGSSFHFRGQHQIPTKNNNRERIEPMLERNVSRRVRLQRDRERSKTRARSWTEQDQSEIVNGARSRAVSPYRSWMVFLADSFFLNGK
jgi:hypothetical protein